MAILLAILLACLAAVAPPSLGVTNDEDVYALNVLFTTLNSPPLTGWMANGGDPCGAFWQGVACSYTNITSLKIPDLNLTGELGSSLENLTALIVLDLSNNLLSSTIPFQLPPHIQNLILSNNQFTGELPSSIAFLTDLDTLNVSSNMIAGAIPDVFDSLDSLTTLDFSNNSLSNSLPASFGNLSSLNALYLQNNHLNGTVDILSNLPLKDLDISNNNFSGWVPSSLRSVPSFKDSENQFNTSPIPPPPPNAFVPLTTPHESPTQSSGHKSSGKNGLSSMSRHKYLTKKRIAGIIVAGVVAMLILVLVILFVGFQPQGKKKAAKKHGFGDPWQGLLVTSDKDQKDDPKLFLPSLVVARAEKTPPLENHTKDKAGTSRMQIVDDVHRSIASSAYSIAELQSMTNSFSQENIIGEGSLGKVYKAELLNGKQLAVKKLGTSMYTTMQQEDFIKIISNVSRLHHPNILQLVGYCLEHGQHLLVYDYIINGTLHENLRSGEENSRSLSWDIRIKIALGAAQALEYLHEICMPPIVHRNFKSTNILLDEEYNPHVADCGVSSFGLEHEVSSLRLGSLDYSAPEYAMSGIYTVKSDVYSFGIVMLELLTGRKPLDRSRPRVEQSLVRWATPQLYDIDALAKMVDPALKGIYPPKALSRFADAIALCVQPEPEFRPSMSEIVQSLSQLMQGKETSQQPFI